VGELLPLFVRLRTRRAKRCRACRHILVRPDISSRRSASSSSKHSSTKVSDSMTFRINLLSKNYLPTLRLTHIPLQSSARNIYEAGMTPHVVHVFALTVFNPLDEAIKVTLGSPPKTPDHGHSVTFMTPSFEVGENKEDDWDVAGVVSLRTKLAEIKQAAVEARELQRPPTGILDRGRNWTTVAFEIIPTDARGSKIEVPLFVSVAYQAEIERDFSAASSSDNKEGSFDKEQREMAFWSVLRLGKVID
ncbi:dynactin p62 family-domain-containing protein, partial [Lipomyces arxii]|uniref:dynactin p62 family-domain-containing protein n=1 Tax=Lipomyces arxii TaxID=56418 RepID=UPI0034CEF5B6